VLSRFVGAFAFGAITLAADIEPPGFRPMPVGSHALVGARVWTRPNTSPDAATILIRDGRITAVGPGLAIPADARTWDMTGTVIYAGFIDAFLPIGRTNPPVSTSAVETSGGLSSGAGGPRFFGVPGGERDAGSPGPGAALATVSPERRMAAEFSPDPKLLGELRELGFAAGNFVPQRGVIRGQSVFGLLADASPNDAILRADTAQHVALEPGLAADTYPASLMGAIAVVRQTWFDAEWYAAAQSARTVTTERPPFSTALAALQATRRTPVPQPVVFEPGSVLMQERAAILARELGLSAQLVASGHEWRRPDIVRSIAAQKLPFIVPLAFPALPKFPDASGWEGVPLEALRNWDWAPENPAALQQAGAEIALTTYGLGDRKAFRKNLRTALDRGLSEATALAALTTVPARLCGVDDQVGTIEPGRLASLTIVEAPGFFDPEARVRAVWIEGRVHEFGPLPFVARSDTSVRTNKTDKAAELMKRRVAGDPQRVRGPIPLTTNAPPPVVWIRHATLWTAGPRGVLTNADLLVRDGVIEAVGSVPVPTGAVLEIDATGRHVSPGLIDCHSHSMILGGVNEATLPSTAMVRIADVVNSEAPTLHQQLAGGLTIANLLHGSANPIGGQNCVIKLRDGASPEALKFARAPGGIKFALGENVKQANWGEKYVTRFPQTRMGVGTFYVNRFTAARRYVVDRARTEGPPVRRDLELEALGEILAGTRLIHCHSYRQDEIVAFLRTMEAFGIRVATLQHILEGYKVADEIARHGAGASAFSDWWAYKYEVIDAIPHAGSLMRQRGVNVSFNSDSSDHARRLNTEAAKAVKYGDTPEPDALAMVTINPARQLGIDRWVGSLEPGKDADFVLWNGAPLDARSVCLETWIEGARFFDRSREPERVRLLTEEHTALLAKAREMSDSPGADTAGEAARQKFFQRALEHARHLGVLRCEDCRLPQRD
jgi:imidazolonepropionase-like amidohydrolase